MSNAAAVDPKDLAAPATELKSLAVRDFSLAIALVAIWSFFASQTHMNFVSALNLSHLAVEVSMTAVLALGQLLIILCGQIALSIGSGVGMLGGITAVLIFEHNWGAAPAMLLATVIALVIWLLMGTLIVSQRI